MPPEPLNAALAGLLRLESAWLKDGEPSKRDGGFEKYRKIGGRVVYALDDLQAWADLGAKNSTSDPGVGTVLPAKRQAPAPLAYAGRERR